MPGDWPCGRTSMRIRGWMGRADQTNQIKGICGRTNRLIRGWMGALRQTTRRKGMFVHPGQVADVARRHPELLRVRLVVTREAEQDVMTLKAETEAPETGLAEAVATTLQALTKLKGRV